MTVNIDYFGTDLASIFETPAQGTVHANVLYLANGTDIAATFTNLSSVSTANGNIASRIPPSGVLLTTGTDLSSVFAGASSNYSLTTPLAPTHAGFTSPVTLTHTFTVTFASAAALTNYFKYGGRITLGPTQGTGTAADTDLAAMFTQIGKVIIYDAGTYISGAGAGVVINSGTTGGSNIGVTQTTLITATEATTYTSNTYVVKITANAATGSATVLTITAILSIVTNGTVVDSYTGTYTSTIQQRNYSGVVTPTQAAPTFATTTAP